MKIISFLFLLFLSSHVSAQIQSGTIAYGVKIDEAEMKNILDKMDNTPNVEDYMRNYIKNLVTSIPHIEFSLDFNKNSALFKGKEAMANDNGIDLERTYMSVGGNGAYFNNKDIAIWQIEYQNEQYRLKKNDFKWKITKETKIIKGYKCFKAITETLIKDKPVVTTAWFCPNLPFQFGPRGFNGLPGLILELNFLDRFLFYPKKIKLSEKNKSIKEPVKGELISEQEFDRMLDRHSSFYKN